MESGEAIFTLRGGYGSRGNRGSQNTRGSSSRGRWRGRPSAVAEPEPALPTGPLIKNLPAIDVDDKAPAFAHSAIITGTKLVTSYTWLKAKTPTVLIPGTPPRWTPPAAVPKLQQDKGDYFRDINAAHFPTHPMEPTAVATLAADERLPRAVHIAGCGSTLGNLLRFVRGEDRPFRMLAEMVGDTLFLVRRERSPRELLKDVHGYGHTFPDAYTTWDRDVRGSVSHQRVIRYEFAGLGVLVRFEVDGYVEDKTEGKDDNSNDDPGVSVDDLAGLANDLGLGGSGSLDHLPAATPLSIRHGGHAVDNARIFDLKTRSANKRDVLDTVAIELPRLWIRQMDRLVLAYHVHGRFDDVRVLSVQERVRDWEQDPAQRPALCRFAALLHHLREEVAAAPDERLEIVYGGAREGDKPRLALHKQVPGTESALSADVKDQWEELSEEREEDEEEEEHDADGKTDQTDEPNVPDNVAAKSDDDPTLDLSQLVSWDDGEEDYTGCSAACDYCGKCTY